MKGSILLTGISGFLGTHTAIQLLEQGYKVSGTLRNLDRVPSIKSIIAAHTSNIDNLSFHQAELMNPDVWMELTRNMDYVQHIASPFPRELPKHEDELVKPAKNGVLNILKAAAANKVKRVVLTSSSGAILYGKPKGKESGIFDEKSWTDSTNLKDTTPYFRSKTIAENAAWEFMQSDQSSLELVTVCPGAILGPVLEEDYGTSANIVLKMMDGSMPAVPNIGFDMVDVRSVAEMLIRSMQIPAAAGERFICSAGFLSFKEISSILRTKYPEHKIPRKVLPNLLTRLLSCFEKSLRPVLLDLGKERKTDNTKAKQMLNWSPRSNQDAILSCAGSLITLGLVKST